MADDRIKLEGKNCHYLVKIRGKQVLSYKGQKLDPKDPDLDLLEAMSKTSGKLVTKVEDTKDSNSKPAAAVKPK